MFPKEDILPQRLLLSTGASCNLSLLLIICTMKRSGLEEQMRQERENGLGLMETSGQRSIGIQIIHFVDLIGVTVWIYVVVNGMTFLANRIIPPSAAYQPKEH